LSRGRRHFQARFPDRHRFKTLIRQEVASTVSAPHEIDEEMNYLQQVLMDKGNDLNVSQKPPVQIP